MLNLSGLEKDITDAIKETFPNAFQQALSETFPEKSKGGEDMAQKFGETITDLIAEPLGKRLASAIDYYVKSGSIKGTIITVGSMVTQTAVISPVNLGNPVAGSVPNTLGIV